MTTEASAAPGATENQPTVVSEAIATATVMLGPLSPRERLIARHAALTAARWAARHLSRKAEEYADAVR